MRGYSRQSHVMARIVAASLVMSLGLGIFTTPPPAAAAVWTVDTYSRSEADVRAAWSALKPTYTGSPYAVAPSVVAPYAPGDLAAGYRVDGVRMIDFGRYLAGLPSDVSASPSYNSVSQYGAVLLKAYGSLSHKPPQPADMDVNFYNTGYASTSSSNIGSGYTTSWAFQQGCLDDDAASTLPTVGHRRWLLYPTLLTTGIGYAEGFHTTYVIGASPQRSPADVSYSYIAWPSPGIFPVEFVSSRTPWSITLNPARYDWDASGFTVTLRRVSDGATWSFDATDSSTAGEYFNANFSNYGVSNAFIFRPNPNSIAYRAGDQFDVTLSGAIFDQGTRTPVAVSYRTSFGALSGAATQFAADTSGPAPTPPPATAPPGHMPVYRFYNKGNSSHFYTASLSERDSVIARLGATYSYEGVAYTVDAANAANTAPLFRFYNKSNGSHFYTASVEERDRVRATLSATYSYDGPAYNVSLTAAGTSPIYRFYNKRNGSHFYTISPTERDTVIATLGATYSYEGPAFYVAQ